MPKIPVRLHQILDYVTVVGFALLPTLFSLTGLPRTLAYVLAPVHLLVTAMTRFTTSSRAPIPLPLHGLIEIVVGPALILLAVLAGWPEPARTVYIATGAIFVIVWTFSDFTHPIPDGAR